VGFAFLYAPALHPALRSVAAVRRELGVRTIFNLVAALANPARVRRQVVGVPERRWVEPLAEVLRRLGVDRAWVVHGTGGIDELALEGDSVVADVSGDTTRMATVAAADAGLRVTSVAEAAGAARAVLAGEPGPARDIVCLNAAAALVVGGAAGDLRDAARLAATVIDDGRAAALLDRVVAFTAAHAAPREASAR